MEIEYDFSGQTAIVTGGSRGIGRAIAAQFVRFGAHVWIWDVDQVELDGPHSLTVDVTNADQIAKAVAQIISQSSRIDILVNNAGYLGRYQLFEQFDPGEWQHILQVNLIGVFEVTRQILPFHATRWAWPYCQYGLACGQGRFAKPRSIFGRECGGNCFHKRPVARGLRH